MGRVPVDFSLVGLFPEDSYTGVVVHLQYQIRTGESWNREGTTDADDFDAWVKEPPERRKIRVRLTLTDSDGKRRPSSYWQDLYFSENGLRMTKDFIQKCGLDTTQDSFETNDLYGRTIGLDMGIKSDPTYGLSNYVKRWYKV